MVYRTAPEEYEVDVEVKLSPQEMAQAIIKYINESPRFSDNVPNTQDTKVLIDHVGRSYAVRVVYKAVRKK